MGKFVKGHPGGPGRPRGSRNRVRMLLDSIAEDASPEVLRKVAEQGKEGEKWAATLVLKHVWGKPVERATVIDLPGITSADTLAIAQAKVIDAAASGEISIKEAAALGALLEAHRRAVHTRDQERRLEEIEKAIAEKSQGTGGGHLP